ncbi:MAG TPA: hypothetical protein VFW87_17345 [Pirellulales bacterium]|nr:hypothetical protein [Pirellulales bacterium]
MANRSFSPSVKQKKDDYHGGCRIRRIPRSIADKDVKSVNIDISFDEALKLLTAMQSAVLSLNRVNRAQKTGKQLGLTLSLKGDAITVIESKLTD